MIAVTLRLSPSLSPQAKGRVGEGYERRRREWAFPKTNAEAKAPLPNPPLALRAKGGDKAATSQ
ncbi:hypothetical protein GCM10027430_11130 [Lysobacter tyrosinilyticus]